MASNIVDFLMQRQFGIGDFDLLGGTDRVIAFDYAGSGRLNHLLAYRPGTGIVYILDNNAGSFASVYSDRGGIGGYDLLDAQDRIIAFDYAGTGRLDHLLVYRPEDWDCSNTG